MTQRKQLRRFFATSSSSWMLLLLSLYFSWICPAESVARLRGYDTTLVGQGPIEVQSRFYQCRFKAPKSHKNKPDLPVFSFQERLNRFQIQVKAGWFQCRYQQNLLPAPSTFYQFQTHLPRSIASC
jgi:hypothetical protein